jgi:hypothetical protein
VSLLSRASICEQTSAEGRTEHGRRYRAMALLQARMGHVGGMGWSCARCRVRRRNMQQRCQGAVTLGSLLQRGELQGPVQQLSGVVARQLFAAGSKIVDAPGVDALLPGLQPPAEALRLLQCCDNADCANMGGDSEAELPVLRCGRCGTVTYCSAVCQRAAWRAGHKEPTAAVEAAGSGGAAA